MDEKMKHDIKLTKEQREMQGLIWRGKILKKVDNNCSYGDYYCVFTCDCSKEHGGLEGKPVFLKVCSQLFVDYKGDKVCIPMEFKSDDGRVYFPIEDKRTPFSRHVSPLERRKFKKLIS